MYQFFHITRQSMYMHEECPNCFNKGENERRSVIKSLQVLLSYGTTTVFFLDKMTNYLF